MEKSYGFQVASSGLIVAFVVALWAAYFVPLVLRRYDEASKNSALDTEGFMRRVVTPKDSSSHKSETKLPAAPTITREAARVAARRRRNTLLTLLGLLAVTVVAAGLGYISRWYLAVPVALIAAWLVACRLMVRQELGLASPRENRFGSSLRGNQPDDQADELSGRPSRWTTIKKTVAEWLPSVEKRNADAADEEDTVIVHFEDVNPEQPHTMEKNAPLAADSLDEKLQIAVPSVGTNGDMLWDPLPVTLPTYISKPRAGRTVRTIDFTDADAWTSGHIEAEGADFPAANKEEGGNPDTNRRAVGH